MLIQVDRSWIFCQFRGIFYSSALWLIWWFVYTSYLLRLFSLSISFSPRKHCILITAVHITLHILPGSFLSDKRSATGSKEIVRDRLAIYNQSGLINIMFANIVQSISCCCNKKSKECWRIKINLNRQNQWNINLLLKIDHIELLFTPTEVVIGIIRMTVPRV